MSEKTEVEKQFEAWEIEDGKLYVELPHGLVDVDGKRYHTDYNRRYAVIDKGATINLVSKQTCYDVAENVETKETIPYAEYQRQLTAVDTRDEADRFPSLEAEFAYRKFNGAWKPVPYTKEVLIPHTANLHSIARPVNEFIVPIWKVSGDFKNTLFHYYKSAHVRSVIRRALLNAGYEEMKECSHYNRCPKGKFFMGERSWYMDETFLSLALRSIKELLDKAAENQSFNVPLSRKDAIKAYNHTETMICNAVSEYALKNKPIQEVLKPEQLVELLVTLRTTKEALNTLVPVKKSASDSKTAWDSVNKAISMVQKACSALGTTPDLVQEQ